MHPCRIVHRDAHSVLPPRRHCRYILGSDCLWEPDHMTTISAPAPSAVTDTFPINGTDYIEF